MKMTKELLEEWKGTHHGEDIFQRQVARKWIEDGGKCMSMNAWNGKLTPMEDARAWDLFMHARGKYWVFRWDKRPGYGRLMWHDSKGDLDYGMCPETDALVFVECE